MSGLWLVAPIALPLVAAVSGAIVRGGPRVQRAVGTAGAVSGLVSGLVLFAAVRPAGVLAVQLGSWPAPYGITLVADLLSASMVLLTGLVGVAGALYAWSEIGEDELRAGFFPFFNVLLGGVAGAFLTGDLFNLYVWFEVMLIASFVLLALGGRRAQLTSGIAYVTLNLLASAFFLVAVGALYGKAGTLNLADLAVRLSEPGTAAAARPAAWLLLVAFGIKAALFPVFFWLPAAYPNAPVAVSAVFAGLLTKVGVYALLRIFTLVFPVGLHGMQAPLAWIAGATMASGVLAAASQSHLRRILSFHIVSQIGYMVMGLALATPLALAAAIFYVIHHILTKTNLFLVGGLAARAGGSEALARIGGLSGSHAGLALLFAVPALSLAGVPPLSGFFAKLLVIRAGLEVEAHALVAVALAVGLLTVFSMTKIWSEAFAKPATAQRPARHRAPRAAVAACAALGVLTVALGIGAQWLLVLAEEAAGQLLHPEAYVEAVLGGRR